MRPRNETARDQLTHLLRRKPGIKAADLAQAANVSLPTMHRMLKELGADAVRIGKAGQTRYYLRRALKGFKGDIPVYAVDTAGKVAQTGSIKLLESQGTWLDVAAMGWPVDAEFALGVWPHGLPYPLQDMRPQGFLGRLFAQSEAKALGVSPNPKEWSDNDVLHILLQRGFDATGNLIIGDAALQMWLDAKAQSPKMLTPQMLARSYVKLAATVTERGVAGSSAGGEFPKFTAVRDLGGRADRGKRGERADSQTPHVMPHVMPHVTPHVMPHATPHVIVKFSAADTSATVQRWSDLLVCEHLALQAIRTIPGVHSAKSRIIQAQGRTFLEVERFDRHGLFGRSALCSLDTLEAAILTQTSTDWGHAGELLLAQGWVDPHTPALLRAIWAFGKLIGNADMHKGNLSFVADPTVVGPVLRVAPVYDMLPMMYAPLAGGELPNSAFSPSLPTPGPRDAWRLAYPAAQGFWQSAALDPRISKTFRDACVRNRVVLERLGAIA